MRQTLTLPDTGFLRLPDVLKLYPVSKSTWWKGIQDGKFPSPVRIGERAIAWRAEDIRTLIESVSVAPQAAASAEGCVQKKTAGYKRRRNRFANKAKQGAP